MMRPLLWPVRRVRKLLGDAPGFRHFYRHLPSERRCKACLLPFHGIFSAPFRFVQLRPSRKNPNLCTL